MAITAPAPTSGTTGSPGTQAAKKNFELKTEDFIKMMITQLQNQDPMEPAKNQELLAQMSQIGQLQSQTQLQDSLKGMVLQNQIGSASTLIGKTVQGLDANDDPITGLVNSVRVADGGVTLELDNGQQLAIGKLSSISPGAAAAATTSPKAA